VLGGEKQAQTRAQFVGLAEKAQQKARRRLG